MMKDNPDDAIDPCQSKIKQFSTCEYGLFSQDNDWLSFLQSENVDDYIPEPPDDDLLCLACNALQEYVLDRSMPCNIRFAAHMAQFDISAMSEWNDLIAETYYCELVDQALTLWESDGFQGFSIARRGMLRAMLLDVRAKPARKQWIHSVCPL